MGWRSSPTWMLALDDARVPASRRVADEGDGFKVALASLDSGRLGIAACGIGVAQAALDEALSFTGDREQFGETGVFEPGHPVHARRHGDPDRSRTTPLPTRGRTPRRGPGLLAPGSTGEALLYRRGDERDDRCVQLHGGYGYITEYPVERYMREAKALQIVEGTNQIQRYVIGRRLTGA